MTYKVTIAGSFFGNKTLPGLNDAIAAGNRHYQKGAKLKKDMQMVCCDAIRRQMGGVKLHPPIKITYTYFEPDKRRDLGNIGAYCDKVFCDALQVCGVIEDDGQKWVRIIRHELGKTDRQFPRIEIEMEEIDG